MDNLQGLSPIFWIITTIITTLSSIVLGALTWIKSAKLMPKELTKADLENKEKEIDLVDRYEDMATKAAEKAINMQVRLSKNEDDINDLKTSIKEQSQTIEMLKTSIKEQSQTIEMQGLIIKEQTLRLDKQEVRIKDQEYEIFGLIKDLNLAQAYNNTLINQMKKENLIPLGVEDIKPEDYMNGSKPKRTYKKKTNVEEKKTEDE